MKKVICLILAICMIIGIKSYCFAFDTTDQSFSATVITCRYIEATDKYSFCAVGDVYGNGGRDPFTFSVARENIKIAEVLSIHIDGGLQAGQIITVYFNGEVMESYPMQIVPSFVVVEDEIEELTEDEKLGYLSMFYSEEWLIENGYMEVPLADGEEAPDENYTDDFVPDYDTEEYDSLDNEYSYVYGTPQEGDDAGKCVMLTKHYLEGFIVTKIMYSGPVEPGPGVNWIEIYFIATSNFGDEMITPVRIEVYENEIGLVGVDFWQIEDGMNLRIYCDYGAYCVPVEGEKYYKIDGDVVTIEKLDGETENYNEYLSYFFEMGTMTDEYVPDVYYGDVDSDEDDVSEELPSAVVDVPIEDEILTDGALVEPSASNSAMTVMWIVVCGGITVVAVIMIILLLKKK